MVAAAFLYGRLSDYDCGKCPPHQREWRGCERDTPAPFMEFPPGNQMRRCPVRALTPPVREIMRHFVHYRAGFLPAPGGTLDQSATALKAFEIVSNMLASFEREDMEEIKRKSRGSGRGRQKP